MNKTRKEALAKARAAAEAWDATQAAKNLLVVLTSYSQRVDDWAVPQLVKVQAGSLSLAAWLDAGDELAKQMATFAKLAKYTTARGVIAALPDAAAGDFKDWLGSFSPSNWSGTTKVLVFGTLGAVGLYFVLRITSAGRDGAKGLAEAARELGKVVK